MIRVLLVDDHEMVRLGVGSYLAAQPDMEVIGEAASGKEAVPLALSLRPDVILMDLVMEKMDGIEATQRIVEEWPDAVVLIVTSFLDDDKVYPALEAGAKSYLLKTSKASHIAESIRKTHAGESVLEPEVTGKMMSRLQEGKKRHPHDELTGRELEVLHLLAQGKSNQDIASELFIAPKTVKVHVSNILSKLEVHDRTQAVVYAFTHNIV